MKLRILFFLGWLLLPVQTAAADTLILVQGYLGNGSSWRTSGIGASLMRAGWRDIGHLATGLYGIVRSGPPPVSGNNAKKRFATVALPTEAPIAVQSDVLARYVRILEASDPEGKIILIGHSAGGVVARAYMVRYRDTKITGLITIAAPNLGTPLAETGRAVGNSPLSWFAPFFGGSTINRSQALYADLSPEYHGNFIGWLNRQPHPKAKYVSIIRARDPAAPAKGDSISRAFEQDLNAVIALRGRAKTVVAPGLHGLHPSDGPLLVKILKEMGEK